MHRSEPYSNQTGISVGRLVYSLLCYTFALTHIHCNNLYSRTLILSSVLSGTCSSSFTSTASALVFFTSNAWVYVMRLVLAPPSRPLRVWCTELVGWHVMRMLWSAPREIVNSSLGETSESSDCTWKKHNRHRTLGGPNRTRDKNAK